jgi:hypothetical protein
MTKVESKFELKPINFVKIDTQRNTASMVFPLEDLAAKPDNANNGFFNFIGLVAVLANDQSPADSRCGLTMSVAYDGPIVLKDLMATMPGYFDPQGLMKTGMDLTVTPLNGLGLQFDERQDFNAASSGQHIKFTTGIATLLRPTITQETEIALNLTAAIRNLTSELTLSGQETPVFTGQFKLRIYRGETGVDAGIPVAWSIEDDNGQYDNESVLSIQRLAAVAPSKRSNFTIRFKVAPPPAGNASCNYSIAIYPIFNIIESNNFSEERECLSGGFSIQVPAPPKTAQ